MCAGYSEIIADSRYGVNVYLCKFCFYISEIRMEKMKGDSVFFGKCSDHLFYGFFGAFEIVIVEIKSNKNISLMELLDDACCMTPES